jgi:DNA polymerase-3 subunit alpha
MTSLVDERRANGPFADIFDLVGRLGPRVLNRRLLEGLVRAGALDGFGYSRAAHLEAIDAALRYGQAVVDAREGGQAGLFDALGANVAIPKPAIVDRGEAAMLEVLEQEHEALGFFLSAHPLDGYRRPLARLGAVPLAEVGPLVAGGDGPRVLKLAGIAVARQERTGARGRFAFVTLSDPSGQSEVTVYSDVLGQARDLLDKTEPLLVHVDGRLDGEDVRLIARDVEPLSAALGDERSLVEIELAAGDAVERLLPLLAEEEKGAARVRLSVPGEAAGERVLIDLPETALLPPARRPDVAVLAGVAAVRDVA